MRADEVRPGDRIREQGEVVEVVDVERRGHLVMLHLGAQGNAYPYVMDEPVNRE